AHFARYLFPLITIPYVVRKLGVTRWGDVAFIQVYGAYLFIVVEFGFNLSATREVSRSRNVPGELERIFGSVLGAKSLLALLAVGLTALLQPHILRFRENPMLLWIAVSASILEGFGLQWFFQGLERIRLLAVLNLLNPLVATVAIFLFVKAPQDGWKLFACYAFAQSFSLTISFLLSFRHLRWRFPEKAFIVEHLRKSFSFFVVRISSMLYFSGNTFILGMWGTPLQIAHFAAAEKLASNLRMILRPAIETLFPRMSYSVVHERRAAVSLSLRILVAFVGIGVLCTIAIDLLAPLVVGILFGAEFRPAVPILRILGLFPLVIGVNHFLGSLWMVPLGLERAFSRVLMVMGVVNCVASIAVVKGWPTDAPVAIAWVIIGVQVAIGITFFAILRIRRLDPFSLAQRGIEA
ncbi:MAG: hypothetical protein D6795_06750, partial [Deltaproteobacteria bacterium]